MNEKKWKEKPARKKWVLVYVNKLKNFFYLQGWTIDLSFVNEDKDEIGAEVTTEWSYRRATILIYPIFWTQTEDERKDMLKHEFCHIVLSQLLSLINGLQHGQMVSKAELHEVHEHVTTWIEGLIPTRLI